MSDLSPLCASKRTCPSTAAPPHRTARAAMAGGPKRAPTSAPGASRAIELPRRTPPQKIRARQCPSRHSANTEQVGACASPWLRGLTKSAIFEALGTSSRKISIRFAIQSPGAYVARPVMLPPGRDRLCTRPSATGSYTATNTIGMLAVADFRATAVCGLLAMSRSGLRATSSAAKAGRRSWEWAKRYSMIRFIPSIQPWFRSPSSHAFCKVGSGSFKARKPSRRRVPCACERCGETSSAALAAMNSRRFIG
jgi:hypothetical protein